MPIVNGKYEAPIWVDGAAPAIDATELQAISNTIKSNQDGLGDVATEQEAMKLSISNLQSTSTTQVQTINQLKNGTLVFANVTVALAAWTGSTEYAGFPFQANVTCLGVTSEHVVNVAFRPVEAMNGNYAPVATSGTNHVTIYAVEKPSGTITLGSVTAIKQTV